MVHQSMPVLREEHFSVEYSFGKTNKTSFAAILPNYSLGIHSHLFYEIYIVLKGTGEHYFGDEVFRLKKGDVFICPPTIKHGFMEDEDLYIFNLMMHPTFLQKHLVELCSIKSFSLLFQVEPLIRIISSADYYLTITDTQLEDLDEVFTILLENQADNPLNNVFSDCGTVMLVAKLCKYYEQNKLTEQHPNINDDHFAKSLSLIYENYSQKITLDQLAQTACMSKSGYLRKFKTIYNTTPAQLLLNWRIEIAKNLLCTTALTVSEIAIKTGFYDSSHFIHIFSTQTGTTPLDYRTSSFNQEP